MIGYNLFFVLIVTATAVIAACFIRKTWFRAAMVALMYLGSILTVTAGMSELRPRIEEARKRGESEEYISGLAARDDQLLQARVEIFVFSTGLVLLGLAGWWRVIGKSGRPDAAQD